MQPTTEIKGPPAAATRLALFNTACLLLLAGWVAYIQYDIRQTNAVATPIVEKRLETLEASSLVTQQALQINCNGNDSFTVLSSNAFAQARFCLLPDPENFTLPEVFATAVVFGNTTEVDVMNDTYYRFDGITNIPDRTPVFYISTSFNRLCGHYSTMEYPDNYVWCIPLANLVCGRSNLVKAQFETAPTHLVTIDVELGFSPAVCDRLPGPV